MMFLFLMVCLFFGDFTSQIRVCSNIYNSQNVFFLWNIFKKIGIYLSRKHSSVSKFPQMTQIWLHNRPRHQYLLLKCFKWPKNIQGHIAIYLIPNDRFYFKIEHFVAKTLFFLFLFRIEDWTQSLTHNRQVLYTYPETPPFCAIF